MAASGLTRSFGDVRLNVRFGLLCRLKSDISRGPVSAIFDHMQCSKLAHVACRGIRKRRRRADGACRTSSEPKTGAPATVLVMDGPGRLVRARRDRDRAGSDERINVLDVDTTAGTATDGRNPRFRYCGLVVHYHLVGPLDDRGAHANGTDTAQLWFRIVRQQRSQMRCERATKSCADSPPRGGAKDIQIDATGSGSGGCYTAVAARSSFR